MKAQDYPFIPMSHSFGRVHAFLFDGGDGLSLLDSLADPNSESILEAIHRIGRQTKDLKRIVLTHGHPTHVKGAAKMKALSGARVYAPIEEQAVIEGQQPSNRTTLVPRRPLRLLPQQILLNLHNILWRSGIRVPVLNVVPVEVDEPIYADDERIGPLIAFKTPGHSPGSTSFYWADTETLFTGDILVTWPKLELGWRGLTEDMPQNLRSIHRLVQTFEARGWNIRRFASGHGAPIATENGVDLLKRLLEGSPIADGMFSPAGASLSAS